MQNRRSGRVLVIGKHPGMGRRLRSALRARGIAAETLTVAKAISEGFDATAFDLVALGGGVEPDDRERLKKTVRRGNPSVQLLDVFAPVAVEQIDRALRGEGDRRHYASEVLFIRHSGNVCVRLDLRRSCRVRVEVHHLGEKLEGWKVEDCEARPGALEVSINQSWLRKGPNMVLAIVGGCEFYFERIDVL